LLLQLFLLRLFLLRLFLLRLFLRQCKELHSETVSNARQLQPVLPALFLLVPQLLSLSPPLLRWCGQGRLASLLLRLRR
jgi:hypothetical protein